MKQFQVFEIENCEFKVQYPVAYGQIASGCDPLKHYWIYFSTDPLPLYLTHDIEVSKLEGHNRVFLYFKKHDLLNPLP